MNKVEKKDERRSYEVNCLVALRNTDQISELAKKLRDWVEAKKGEMIKVGKEGAGETAKAESDIWVDKRRLAYPISKDRAGYYLNMWLRLDPALLSDFKRFLKLEREITRYILLREDQKTSFQPNEEAVVLGDVQHLANRNFDQGRGREPGARIEERRFEGRKTVVRTAEKKEESIAQKEEPLPVEKAVPEDKKGLLSDVPEKKAVEKLSEEKKPEVKKLLKPKSKKPAKKEIKPELKEEEKREESEKEEKEEEKKPAKQKKISLEELDKRLDDILNEEIL